MNTNRTVFAQQALVSILQLAYSGELAAAYAYRGHWHSVSDENEREAIRQIEEDEWHHRRLVGQMLEQLGANPDRIREIRAFLIGRALGLLCFVCGWLAPMYGAGKLESRNILEYELAASRAVDSGHEDFLECLLGMAEVEWEHERYFRSKVLAHRWAKSLRLWPEPPPKVNIRARFYAYQRPQESAALPGRELVT